MQSRFLSGWVMGTALFAMTSLASAQPPPLEADLILRDASDLLALDRNPFKIPVTQVHETTVKLALISGEIVFRALQG